MDRKASVQFVIFNLKGSEVRTPAGIECDYFYGDYYRGRNREECKLLKESSQEWKPSFCKSCPVPSILRANSCEFMAISAKISRPAMALFQPRVKVTAICHKTQRTVAEPHIGCGECHPTLPKIEVKK